MSTKPTGHKRVLQRPLQFGDSGAPALIGGGTSADPIELDVASQHAVDLRVTQEAASGDNRLAYLRFTLTGGGGGDCVRAFARIAAATGTAHGLHATLQINVAPGAISGLAAGVRATLAAEAASRTLTGTLAALQVDSDVGANNTLPAQTAFIRVADNNSVKIPNLFSIAAGSSVLAGSAANSASDALKVYIEGTGVRYLDLHDGVA